MIGGHLGFWGAFLYTARFNRRFDKRPTIMLSAIGLVFFAALPVCLRLAGWFPVNDRPALLWFLIANAVFPIVFGALLNISVMSSLADIVDEHELATGRRQEGRESATPTPANSG